MRTAYHRAERVVIPFESAGVVPDLIDLIYRAAVSPSQWQGFVLALSESCGGAAVAISLHLNEPETPNNGARIGLLDEYSPVFAKHLRQGLPWGSLVAPHYTQSFGFGSDVLGNDDVVDTDFYRDYMQPQGLASEGPMLHVFAQNQSSPLAALLIYRRDDTRSLDQRDLRRCDELVPHLKRAYRIHNEMHGESERRKALAAVVDRFPMGVVLLDSKHRSVIVNKTAGEMLAHDDGLSLDHDRPVARSARENVELQQAIVDAGDSARTGHAGTTHSISITRPSGDAPFSVMVSSLTGVLQEADVHDAIVAMFISTPAAGKIRSDVLQDLYGFTPAEAGLVCRLVSGDSLDDAAKARGIKKTTARGYLKAIYQKTATRSQSDLIRLVLTGVGPIREQ